MISNKNIGSSRTSLANEDGKRDSITNEMISNDS